MLNFSEKSLLIAGGAGSLGKALTSHKMQNSLEIKRLVIFSRDEHKQFQMAQEYPAAQFNSSR